MHKILLLSQENDSRSFLSVTRSLGEQNLVIHSASNQAIATTVCSRYIKKRIILPKFSSENNNWLNELTNILKHEEYTLVIPCDDLSVIYLHSFRNQLSPYAKLYLIDSKIYDIVNNKHKTTQLAVSLGICTPKSILIKDNKKIKQLINEFSFPLVLKPISSFDEKSTERHNVVIIYDLDALISEVDLILINSPVQIQSFFKGIGVAVSVLAKDGHIIVASQHKRLHEPFSGGGSSYRISMEINRELFSASQKIIQNLQYTGIAMLEFRYNLNTNEWVLLEINARFWGSLPLAISAGINYPYLLYKMLIDEKISTNKIKYKINIYQRNLEADMYWLNDAIFNSDINELEMHGYTYKKILFECLNIITFKDKIDTFSFRDPCPFISEIFTILKHINVIIFKKIRHSLLRQKLIRRKIKHHLTSKLNKSKNVLFVCKGNICRSPFAEQAARSLWATIPTINSTGYYKEINRTVPNIALQPASNYSIDLSNHKSELIHLEQVKNADLIFYFDEENRSYLRDKYPFYKKKMYFISLLSDELSIEIDDPIDKSASEFRKTYKGIYNLLKDINISNS